MTKVFVSNLAWRTSWQDLKDHFKSLNLEPVHADVFKDSEGRSRGIGIVELSSEEEAARAITTANETELNGRNITVREDKGSAAGGRGRGEGGRGFGRRGDGEGGRGFGRRGDGEGRGYFRRGDGEGGRGFGRRGDGEGRGFGRRGDGGFGRGDGEGRGFGRRGDGGFGRGFARGERN